MKGSNIFWQISAIINPHQNSQSWSGLLPLLLLQEPGDISVRRRINRITLSKFSCPLFYCWGQFQFLDCHGSVLQAQLILERKGRENRTEDGCVLCPNPWAQTHCNFINCIIWDVLPVTCAQGTRRKVMSLRFLLVHVILLRVALSEQQFQRLSYSSEERMDGNADSFLCLREWLQIQGAFLHDSALSSEVNSKPSSFWDIIMWRAPGDIDQVLDLN